MEYSFPRYLLSKQSVDDRALNRVVLDALRANLPAEPVRIIEVGAGIGTMLARLVRGNIVRRRNMFWWTRCPRTRTSRGRGFRNGQPKQAWAWKEASRIRFGCSTTRGRSASASSARTSSISSKEKMRPPTC